MVVTKSTPEEEAACVTFLKWFTQPENNIQFAVGSGYLPVTHAADDMTAIENSGLELTDSMKDILANAIDAVENHELYTPKPFEGGTDARKVLEYSMSDLASADRAAVEEQLAAGVSAAEAEALYLTDEYFENWYSISLRQTECLRGLMPIHGAGKEGKTGVKKETAYQKRGCSIFCKIPALPAGWCFWQKCCC